MWKWVFLLVFIISCEGNNEPAKLVSLDTPAHFPEPPAFPERNPLTEQGIELGRMLFYDPILSANGSVSCATCHNPQVAFTDGMPRTRMGVSHNRLDRHSPAIFNLAWHTEFFWDGGANDLESQAFGPLQHPDEMAADIVAVIEKMNEENEYPKMFKMAFGTDTITSAGIVRALAQFQRTIISADSKYDRYIAGGEELSSLELKGLELFNQHCETCHQPPLFTDLGYHNNGLNINFSADKEGIFQGRFRISLDSADIGSFKTPSLRNVAFTAPYMHDGRMRSLDRVLDFYAGDIKWSPTLSERIPPEGFGFDDEEKAALKAFLLSLTDKDFVKNPKYAKPPGN